MQGTPFEIKVSPELGDLQLREVQAGGKHVIVNLAEAVKREFGDQLIKNFDFDITIFIIKINIFIYHSHFY